MGLKAGFCACLSCAEALWAVSQAQEGHFKLLLLGLGKYY